MASVLTAISPYNQSTNYLFNPNIVSTCSVWLDGQDRTTMVFSGNNVTTWKDKSGANNHATASGYISNIPCINGYNAMAYPGVTSTFFRGPLVNTTNGSVTGFAVLNMFATSYSAIRAISLGVSTTTDYNNVLYTGLIERGGSGLNSYRNLTNGATASYTTGTPALVCSIYDGTNNYFYVNGNAGTPVASSGNFGYSNYEIGSEFGEDTVSVVHYDGYIGEIIMYNKISLNTQQRQQVEGILAWKWGLQSQLPASHPYYNNAYISNSYPISYFPPKLNPTNVIPSLTIPSNITQYIYNPAQIPGLSLWLDAADATSIIQSGGNVSQWKDKSGNGRNATQISNAYRPTYMGPSVGVSFNGVSSQYLQYSGSIGGPQTTIFLICSQSISTTGASLFGIYGSTDTSSGTGKVIGSIFADNTMYVYGANGYYAANYPASAPYPTAMFEDWMDSTNATGSRYYNGNFLTTGSAPLYNSSLGYILGARYAIVVTSPYVTGIINEIAFYSTILTTNQRQQVEGYLGWKWGLQKSLPSSHPYVLFPPG